MDALILLGAASGLPLLFRSETAIKVFRDNQAIPSTLPSLLLGKR